MMNNNASWWDQESRLFSHLSGERVSRFEVVMVHAFVIGVMLLCGLAEWIGG